jgi:AmiR/NasT family two-component response regulator
LIGDARESVVFDRATGVIMAQMGMGAQEARDCLRAQAAAVGRAVSEVAADLVERRLRMTASGLVDGSR